MSTTLLLGNCLDKMAEIPPKSIDMVLCDLPYGTTKCKWDSVINLDMLWDNYRRVCKVDSTIVLTASQPFTSFLVTSNAECFKYEWIWEKSKASNFLLARRQPLKAHESVLVFSFGTPSYYPQKTAGVPFKGAGRSKKGSNTDLVNNVPNPTFRNDNDGDRFPRSVQYFVTAEKEGCLHPTQKPVALMDYLIRTYSKEEDTVLDNAMGSGTTGVACFRLGRRFIGIENQEDYFNIARKRIYAEHGPLTPAQS